MALRDAGWRIANVACSLGREGQRDRREAELREACDLAGFELRLPPEPIAISAEADPEASRRALTALAVAEIAATEPTVVLSPATGDRHHGHRVVAEAVREALAAAPHPPRWWMWELWGTLPRPTIGTLFDGERLEEILTALAAHRGELARNDYRRFVRGRAEMNVSLAAELLFGFGANAPADAGYAELLTEMVWADGWLLGSPRWLDAADPLKEPRTDEAAPVEPRFRSARAG